MPDKEHKEKSSAIEQNTQPSNHLVELGDSIRRVLEAFPKEIAKGMNLTNEEVTAIMQATNKGVNSLSATIPRKCEEGNCEYSSVCVFYKLDLTKPGILCPDEIMFIETAAPQLAKDMAIDTENYVEWDMLQDYVDAMVRERRARRLLSLEGETQESVTAVDQKSGTAFYEKRLNVAHEILLRSQKRKDKIRKDLLLTREMRLKFQTEAGKDESTSLSDLRSRLTDPIKNAEDAEVSEIPKPDKES